MSLMKKPTPPRIHAGNCCCRACNTLRGGGSDIIPSDFRGGAAIAWLAALAGYAAIIVWLVLAMGGPAQ